MKIKQSMKTNSIQQRLVVGLGLISLVLMWGGGNAYAVGPDAAKAIATENPGSTNEENTSEIAQLLAEAQDAYAKGYLKLASTRMNQALSIIKELEGQRAKKVFPPPLEGWKSGEGDAALKSIKSMGIGSVLATALNYIKDEKNIKDEKSSKDEKSTKGEESIQIVLVQKPSSPQPLFDLVMMGMMMPRAGSEKFTIQGNSAHYVCKKDLPGQCDLAIPVEADYVLLLSGKNSTKETMVRYAEAIRYDILKELR